MTSRARQIFVRQRRSRLSSSQRRPGPISALDTGLRRYDEKGTVGLDATCADPTARGFTLIELVVVLAIIGLSLAVVIPLFGAGGRATALTAATGEIRAALRTARSTAIAEDRKVFF